VEKKNFPVENGLSKKSVEKSPDPSTSPVEPQNPTAQAFPRLFHTEKRQRPGVENLGPVHSRLEKNKLPLGNGL